MRLAFTTGEPISFLIEPTTETPTEGGVQYLEKRDGPPFRTFATTLPFCERKARSPSALLQKREVKDLLVSPSLLIKGGEKESFFSQQSKKPFFPNRRRRSGGWIAEEVKRRQDDFSTSSALSPTKPKKKVVSAPSKPSKLPKPKVMVKGNRETGPSPRGEREGHDTNHAKDWLLFIGFEYSRLDIPPVIESKLEFFICFEEAECGGWPAFSEVDFLGNFTRNVFVFPIFMPSILKSLKPINRGFGITNSAPIFHFKGEFNLPFIKRYLRGTSLLRSGRSRVV